MVLFIHNAGLSMVLVLCHHVKIHIGPYEQQSIFDGHTLPRRKVQKCLHAIWNDPMPEYSHLLDTPMTQLTIWLAQLCEGRIWGNHDQELDEFVNPQMLFHDGSYPVHQIFWHANIDVMKYIAHTNSGWRDACHFPYDAFRF